MCSKVNIHLYTTYKIRFTCTIILNYIIRKRHIIVTGFESTSVIALLHWSYFGVARCLVKLYCSSFESCKDDPSHMEKDGSFLGWVNFTMKFEYIYCILLYLEAWTVLQNYMIIIYIIALYQHYIYIYKYDILFSIAGYQCVQDISLFDAVYFPCIYV